MAQSGEQMVCLTVYPSSTCNGMMELLEMFEKLQANASRIAVGQMTATGDQQHNFQTCSTLAQVLHPKNAPPQSMNVNQESSAEYKISCNDSMTR